MEDQIIAYFRQYKKATRPQACRDIGCSMSDLRMVLDGKTNLTVSMRANKALHVAKRELRAANRSGGVPLKKVTATKTRPEYCAGKTATGTVCASIAPKVGATLCQPCLEAFAENAQRDLTFTNYRSQMDYR